MSSVSCLVISTLVVISVANLLLLVHVILHSCQPFRYPLKKFPKFRRDAPKLTSTKYKFSAALILGAEDDFQFICGVAIITKKWVLTSAHCVEPVLNQNSAKIAQSKYGTIFDIEEIVIHEEHQEVDRNVAVIRIVQNFKEKEVVMLPVAQRNYKYLAGSNATVFGWTDNEMVGVNVKLLEHKKCEKVYSGKISGATFCVEKKGCMVDSGGFVVQKNVLVGVVTMGVGCDDQPVVYTKISVFEEWFRRAKIAAVFKS